jgi:succinate dehydrogenase subunit C
MSDRQAHTPYHPQWHRTRPSTYWWLERRAYFAFILREVSSVFVAWFVLYLVKLTWALAHGAGWYAAFLRWSSHPVVIALNAVTFFFVTFHAVTWFNLAPKAMVVEVGGRRLPAAVVTGANYAAWAVVSAALAWLVLRR